MKKLLALALASFAPLAGTQYVALEMGTNTCEMTNSKGSSGSNQSPKVGITGGAKYGYLFTSGVRAELAVTYRLNNFRTKYTLVGDDNVGTKTYRSLHCWSYMANLLYDINQLGLYNITPYVGMGIGYAQNTEKNKYKYDEGSQEYKMKDNRFAWQGIAGAKYAINETTSAGIEYHYFCGRSHAKDHSFAMTIARNF